MHKLRQRGVAVSAMLLLLVTSPVYAQGLVPCKGTPDDPCEVSDFLNLFANIYNYLLGLAGIIAVIMIVYSGVRMLTYFWSESPEQDLTNAKHSLTRAITGFVIIVAAYLIVNTLLASILGAGPLADFLKRFGGQ